VNREQKIALILGFAVILVVGVLVSDHWSAAQRLHLADATEGDLGRAETGPVAMLPDVGGEASRLASMTPPTPPTGANGEQAQPDPTLTPADPLTVALGGNGEVSPLGRAMQQAGTPGDETPTQPDARQSPLDRLGERLARGLDGGLPVAAGFDPPMDAQANRPPEPQVREVPAPVRHTVAKSESLFKISAQYLGDGNRWREIAEANRGKVGPDGSVRSGVTLVIPNATAPAPARAVPTIGPRETRVAETPVLSKPITYTVAKNDSLGEISRRFLGSSRLTHLIVRANPGKISDPDDIRVGMVLTIPARS